MAATTPKVALSPIQPIKISQRPTKSCTECIRRKTRCNKQVPCDVCVRRGVPTACRLESQFAFVASSASGGNTAPISDIEALRKSVFTELSDLRHRVAALERIASEKTPTSGNSDSREGEGDAEAEAEGETETEDAATTLEFFALGLDRRVGGRPDQPVGRDTGAHAAPRQVQDSSQSLREYAHIAPVPGATPPDGVTDSLLPQHIVEAILTFHDEHVYWQHACIYSPRFRDEVDAFYATLRRDQAQGWARVDGAWLALFYVLQAIAVHQMDDAQAVRCGLNEADRFVLPSALIASAQSALQHATFLSKPSMFTCQAIAILCVCGHNVCESDLLSSLLAIGIKTAQTLNLHSLGRGSRGDAIQHEMGKRVWWALTMEDWFAIPFRGVWSVHPDHFDTPLPSNCHDSDLAKGHTASRPEEEVTVGFKSRFAAQSASVIQNTFHRLRHASSASAWAVASDATDQVRHLMQLLPSVQPGSPSWTTNMRHYLTISASHKILTIYRAFLARGGTPSERAYAQAECLKAAESIIHEMDNQEGSQALWTIPYHTLAAGVVLALEVISSRGKKDHGLARRREGVEKARKALERLAPTSRIARRGLQVLEDLMKEAEGKRKRGHDGMARMVKKIKLPDDVLLESAPHSPSELVAVPSYDLGQTLGEISPENTLTPPTFSWSPGDMDTLLASLQQTVPDVGRLFDGSLGDYGFGFAGGAS
ncbi:hypothetical protein IAU60_003208 [Kwoniella sp. DSM 27419]